MAQASGLWARVGGNVPLTNCPECGRRVSTAAEACPGCGHPLRARAAAAAAAGPPCYACPAPATTRCQSCGTLSFAQHVDSIYVSHGRGGAYELRCEGCCNSAMIWKVIGFVFSAVVAVVALSFAASKGVGPFAR